MESDERIRATIDALMVGYDAKWKHDDWITVCVETEFHLPILNPDTGRKSRTFTHAGKYDGIIEQRGHPYLLEHKTTSEDISDPESPYWRRLAIDAQVSGYVLSQWQTGQKLAGTLYDVIRKPGIRPKALSKQAQFGIVNLGTYASANVSEDTKVAVANGLDTENAELFRARLIADIKERPDWYFQRRIVPRLDAELLEYAHEFWDTADEIRLARANNRHFRNPGACMLYNTPCQFLGLCSGHDSIDGDNWRRKESVHAELGLDNGTNVLSHTRMQTFRTCRRKHYYQYELGIERNKDEEALYFGSLMHEALADWWSKKGARE